MRRYKRSCIGFPGKIVFLIGLSATLATAGAQEKSRYIFLNAVPGVTFKVGRPSTFTRKFFDEVTRRVAPVQNQKMRLGVSVLFDYLSVSLDSVEKSLDRFLQLSQEMNMPVLVNLDGINWMNGRPDLWNWWDPKKPGYNPANRKNVEWAGWEDSSALKISWRNWGVQFRTLPAPNLASEAVMAAQIEALKRLVPRIVRWHRALPADKKYLLGGVKLGHETSIGVNAYFYKNGNRYLEQMPHNTSLDPQESFNPEGGFNGGLATIGYAAVKTAGIKNKGKLTAYEIEKVVYQYLDTLSKTAHLLGLPRDLLFTHQGGTFAPWDKHLSFSAAANNHSLPGWSLYSTNPAEAGDMGDLLDRQTADGWAAAEWWWPGANKAEWKYNLSKTLSYKGCRFLAIFNWERGLEKNEEGIAAVRELLAEWK